MELPTPDFIGKYAIRRRMGSGAMGVVYEGFDPHIERKVAIKCLHPDLVLQDTSGQFLRRFKQEAQAAASCSHTNIVTILEYGELEHSPYIVMEYVEGINLQELLSQGRVRHLKNVISFVGQILNALQAAHEQGVVHRDIKPANVLVMKNGTVKLADFGIARVPTDQSLTHTGLAIGTPRYMSPEQAMAQPTDQRTDLYALTMMFAQMLTELALDKSIPSECLPDINGLARSHYINNHVPVPIALIAIIEKGLALNPDDRIPSARDYLDSLRIAVDSMKDPLPSSRVASDAETEVAPGPGINQAVTDKTAADDPALRPDPISEPEPITETALVPDSSRAFDPVELQSLQTLLSGYIGPIAQNIVEYESGRHQQPADLARALSSEIDDPQERAAFLRDWERSAGLSTAQRSAQSESTATGSTAAFDLTDDARAELVKALAQHLGPLAGRLVAMHQSDSRSVRDLIRALAGEIDDDDDRRQFEVQFSRL